MHDAPKNDWLQGNARRSPKKAKKGIVGAEEIVEDRWISFPGHSSFTNGKIFHRFFCRRDSFWLIPFEVASLSWISIQFFSKFHKLPAHFKFNVDFFVVRSLYVILNQDRWKKYRWTNSVNVWCLFLFVDSAFRFVVKLVVENVTDRPEPLINLLWYWLELNIQFV